MNRLRVAIAALMMCHWCLTSYAALDAKTKYPIVLIHGYFGFGDGMSWLARYFGAIPAMLKSQGATVYIADVGQVNTIEARGEELYRQLLLWGHLKYNLIGHSHGGLDARYVLEAYPAIVASVTTIGSPHHGSRVADYLYDKITRHRTARLLLLNLGEVLGRTIGFLSGTMHAQNVIDSLQGLTTTGIEEFNRTHRLGISDEYCEEGPYEDNGRKFYSWGTAEGEFHFGASMLGPFYFLSSRAFWEHEENDGLVALCSMKFGKWLGAEMEGHHLVPVGGVMVRITPEQEAWVYGMFLDHARRLKEDGF